MATEVNVKANRLYMLYLEHSYRYYECNAPVIEDWQFDDLCVELLTMADDVTSPVIKTHPVDKGALAAGTGYQLTGHWPMGAIGYMMKARSNFLMGKVNPNAPYENYGY